ncbi:hypothetical protein DA075_10105 [Methylobacterium currus]|uniref:Uncharacterized protein n=2 Tax=Methylobacterium currus TaxID=2051553 RepID=A0A2R4WI55_9HYPH|nr:hypothetical protein DA075_10105 [Methylobacterium currus]
MDDLIRTYSGALEEIPGEFRRMAISASRVPGIAERAALEERRDELARALRQGGKAHQPAVARLLGAFPAFGADDISTADAIDDWVKILSPLPVWAVAEAVQRFRESRATTPYDRGRCPTEPQVIAEARVLTAPIDEELRRIAAILDAEVIPEPSPEDREKVAQLVRDLAASLRSPVPQLAEAELARVTEGGMGGLKLDRRILAKAGVPSEAA